MNSSASSHQSPPTSHFGGKKKKTSTKRNYFRIPWVKRKNKSEDDGSDSNSSCSSASEYSVSEDDQSTTIVRSTVSSGNKKNAGVSTKKCTTLNYDSDESKTEDDIGLSQIINGNGGDHHLSDINTVILEATSGKASSTTEAAIKKESKKSKKKSFTSFFLKMFRFRRRLSGKYGKSLFTSKDKRPTSTNQPISPNAIGTSCPPESDYETIVSTSVRSKHENEISCPGQNVTQTDTTCSGTVSSLENSDMPHKISKIEKSPKQSSSLDSQNTASAFPPSDNDALLLTSHSNSTVDSGSKPPRPTDTPSERKSRNIDILNNSGNPGKPPLDRNSPVNIRTLSRGTSMNNLSPVTDSPQKSTTAGNSSRIKSPAMLASQPRSLLRGESDNSMISNSYKGSRASSVSSLERHPSVNSMGNFSIVAPGYDTRDDGGFHMAENSGFRQSDVLFGDDKEVQILISQGLTREEALYHIAGSKAVRKPVVNNGQQELLLMTKPLNSNLHSQRVSESSPAHSRHNSFPDGHTSVVNQYLLSSSDSTPNQSFYGEVQSAVIPPNSPMYNDPANGKGSTVGSRVQSMNSKWSGTGYVVNDISYHQNIPPPMPPYSIDIRPTDIESDGLSVNTTGTYSSYAPERQTMSMSHQPITPYSNVGMISHGYVHPAIHTQPSPPPSSITSSKILQSEPMAVNNAEAVALELAIKMSLQEVAKQPKRSDAEEIHRRAIEEANENALRQAMEASKSEYSKKSKIRGAKVQATAAKFEEDALQRQSRRSTMYGRRSVQPSPISPNIGKENYNRPHSTA